MQDCHLVNHLIRWHSIYPDVSTTGSVAVSLGQAPAPYQISMPQASMPMTCPVEGCLAHLSDQFGLCQHFLFCHPACDLAILEEGLLPKCPLCCMHVLLASVSTHYLMALCCQGTRLQQTEALLEMCHLAREVIFSVRGTPLESVSTSFNYLCHPLSCFGDDWNALHKNLDKAHLHWTLISLVLAHERVSP